MILGYSLVRLLFCVILKNRHHCSFGIHFSLYLTNPFSKDCHFAVSFYFYLFFSEFLNKRLLLYYLLSDIKLPNLLSDAFLGSVRKCCSFHDLLDGLQRGQKLMPQPQDYNSIKV